MKNLTLVKGWLNAGAIYLDGVLLFTKLFGSDHPFLVLLKKHSPAKARILRSTLTSFARRNPGDEQEPVAAVLVAPDKSKVKLREDYAFLSDPNCPNELKILAANKLTAYHNYVSGHKKLFECHNAVEQFEAAKFVTENFIENRLIIKELEFYKHNKTILGDHPMFSALKRLRELNKKSVVELIKHRANLGHNIWRIKQQIAKKDKKHLQVERERSIAEKEFEISEITKILAKYE